MPLIVPPPRSASFMSPAAASNNHDLTACIVPPLTAFLDGALAGAALIVLAEDRQSLDTREDREGCDGANRAKRPSWPEPELPGREARLDAFSDRQAHGHGVIGVELDRGAGSDTQHAPVDLLSVCRQPGPVHRRDSVGLNRAHSRKHRWHANDRLTFSPGTFGMEAENTAGDVVGEVKAPGRKIGCDEVPPDLGAVPKLAGAAPLVWGRSKDKFGP